MLGARRADCYSAGMNYSLGRRRCVLALWCLAAAGEEKGLPLYRISGSQVLRIVSGGANRKEKYLFSEFTEPSDSISLFFPPTSTTSPAEKSIILLTPLKYDYILTTSIYHHLKFYILHKILLSILILKII